MQNYDALYRIYAYVRHMLTAWNTTGEGIHSPYLFHLVSFVLRDKNRFYCFSDIERRREALLNDTRVLAVVDYGSGGSPEGLHVQRKVCDIAHGHLERAAVGQMLFRLVNFLSQNAERPLEILELGTSLGITTAYLAMPNSQNKVMTLEGSSAVAKVAREQWQALRLTNIECVEGRIEDTLLLIRARERLDLVYVDANHTYEATRKYVECLLPRLTEKGVIAIDDIHYSREMERAWKVLQADERVTSSMDMGHIGLLFVDKHYLKRHYRLRL